MDLRVGIVGAGAAGLAALKAVAGAGLDVTCFERGDRVGGIWVLDNSSGLSSAYRSLHCNTSRARTEFEDLPSLPVACAVWEPRPSLSTSAESWLLAGGPHHTVLTTAIG